MLTCSHYVRYSSLYKSLPPSFVGPYLGFEVVVGGFDLERPEYGVT